MIYRTLQRLLSRARMTITQVASDSHNTSQVVNVNVLLENNKCLKTVTSELIHLSRESTASFQTITEFLRHIAPEKCSNLEIVLLQSWLLKVVAANHIHLAKQHASIDDFQLVMMDTSLYDQSPTSWLRNEDFLSVVDFDAHLATYQNRCGIRTPVIRIFFVPSSEFVKQHRKCITATVHEQAKRGIECAVARSDYIALIEAELVCDLFLIRETLVCVIEKPYWQFELHTDKQTVAQYHDRAKAVLDSDFVIVVNNDTMNDIDPLLQDLADL